LGGVIFTGHRERKVKIHPGIRVENKKNQKRVVKKARTPTGKKKAYAQGIKGTGVESFPFGWNGKKVLGGQTTGEGGNAK